MWQRGVGGRERKFFIFFVSRPLTDLTLPHFSAPPKNIAPDRKSGSKRLRNGFSFVIFFVQLTSCTEQIVELMQERDILQDANNQMNEVSARKLQVSIKTVQCTPVYTRTLLKVDHLRAVMIGNDNGSNDNAAKQ